MTRPLRIRHRRIFTVLGVVLPVAFGLGIAARRPAPQMTAVPAGLQAAPQPSGVLVWERTDLFKTTPARVRLLRDGERLSIACTASGDFARPDLLVYWTGEGAQVTDTLPENTVLLGAFNSPSLPLPIDAAGSRGVLILFSLADQEVVAVSQLIRFNSSPL